MRKKWIWVISSAVLLIGIIIAVQTVFTSEDSAGLNVPLAGKVVVLDPGHGGIDGGASSRAGDLEKDIALEITFILRDYLQEAGALVLMTREGDHDLAADGTKRIRARKVEDLKRRVDLINNSNADLFISLHLNAIPTPKWSGAQTFYNRSIEKSDVLAKQIQAEIMRNLENTNRDARPINSVYLIQQSKIPGALVEVGFLSNPTEAELLKTKDYQQSVAASIYEGILRYANGDPIPGGGQ
ncbi:N-acetylmuramoyl-L-alanine amidase CwlD [Alteribacter natronophilus]|uniref:N-acetylmuramoyl-L-alanine amidase CwlD n=1 Tax=Alteribacter natronophilus TaxID=2583810 RepID=UPI00110E7395|nr:N-acetylmuramoyl-L-alanine amidase CwlD [Alteribacter natronophilus]TMW70074.1 N-acetylmuramoyl-L-alanine amidase CwlD [Alteribacter natronophilus]